MTEERKNFPLRVRVISPWPKRLQLPGAIFDTDFSSEEADAMLAYWAPSDELFSFPRRKAWYCCEPWCQFKGLGGGSWPGIRERLAPHEFLCHNQPDPQYRVPHVTHFDALEMKVEGERLNRAVAIVSNHGGNPLKRHRDLTYRNDFITHPQVDLFGRSGWNRYRRRWFSRSGNPENYQGELPGDWPAAGKRELMARYKVAVCFENMNEPFYFTEKFVEAVCAGCVPVYRAGPTVVDTVLKGACWVDPVDYGNDAQRTIQAALEADATEFQSINMRWLESRILAESGHQAVFARIASILLK